MDILPPAQQFLWPKLHPVTELGYVLYGGTAIALRLGHRISVDFDFFCEQALDRKKITDALPFIVKATTIQDTHNTWTLLISPSTLVGDKEDYVKISFFGGIDFGRIGTPDFTEDKVLQVASLSDLLATKLKVILQRAEAKDYRDIAEIIKNGADLSFGLAAARALFGPNFQPSESLKALIYFDDGDLNTLSVVEKNILIYAVKQVGALPAVEMLSKKLAIEPYSE